MPPHTPRPHDRWRCLHLAPAIVADLQAYIQAHLDEPLTVAVLARVARRGTWYFARSWRITTGETPMGTVRRVRLERAAWLLTHTALPCVQIALEVGWIYPNRLSLHFRRWAGVGPHQYRQRARAMAREVPSAPAP